MAKVMNAILGIAVGVIVIIVLFLGIQVFYPEPELDDFCDREERFPTPLIEGEEINKTPSKEPNCYDVYDEAREAYNTVYFIITAILGILVIGAAFFLLQYVNIAAGLILAGVFTIFIGFMTGWDATSDVLKFIFALIDAAIIIGFAVYLNKKGKKKR